MKKRVLSAIVMFAVLVGAFAFRLIPDYGTIVFDLLVGVLAIFCSLEMCKILSKMNILHSQMAVGIYPSMMFAGHIFAFLFELEFYLWIVIQISILIFMALATFVFYVSLNNRFIKNLKKETKLNKFKLAIKVSLGSFVGFIYPSLLFISFMLMNRIDELKFGFVSNFSGNLAWLLLVVAIVIPIVTDTFAMLCGSLLKGPKLCEKISPKKTVSGASLAVVFSIIVSGALFFVFNAFDVYKLAFISLNVKMWHFVLFGFLCSIVCQAGDIFESFLKRKANLKDSGNIIPGHGGFLDRLDSHLFGAPLTILFFVLLFVI